MRRSLFSRWPGAVLIVVMLVGLWFSLPLLWSERALWRASGWWLGESERAVAQRLDEGWSARPAVVLPRRVADWLLLGDLGPAVRQGCDGWLFLMEELVVHPQAEQMLQRRAEMVAQVARLLAQQHIELQVVVVPDKSRIEAAHRCGLPRPAQVERRYAAFVAQLHGLGLSPLPLDRLLGDAPGERYFRSDTHWNEQGARLVADRVAARLQPPRGRWDTTDPVTFQPSAQHERVGDLIRLAGLDRVPAMLRPAGDMVRVSRVVEPARAEEGDLLGDAPSPAVVVVGSSYSRTANFVPFLSAALSTPVANLAQDGAGFAGVVRGYFDNEAFRNTPPKVLVWEFPERVIDAPLSDQERDWARQLDAGCLACRR
jgi:alginate O-acetyltransferase complex protein AlgJ